MGSVLPCSVSGSYAYWSRILIFPVRCWLAPGKQPTTWLGKQISKPYKGKSCQQSSTLLTWTSPPFSLKSLAILVSHPLWPLPFWFPHHSNSNRNLVIKRLQSFNHLLLWSDWIKTKTLLVASGVLAHLRHFPLALCTPAMLSFVSQPHLLFASSILCED